MTVRSTLGVLSSGNAKTTIKRLQHELNLMLHLSPINLKKVVYKSTVRLEQNLLYLFKAAACKFGTLGSLLKIAIVLIIPLVQLKKDQFMLEILLKRIPTQSF